MKKITILLALALVCYASLAEAGYAPSRHSRGSYSRSYRSSPPVVHNNTTVIHHDSGSGSFMPFALGMMMGHNSSPQPQTVIVQQPQSVAVAPAAPVAAPIPVAPVAAAPAVVKEEVIVADKEDDSLSPLQTAMLIFAGIGLITFFLKSIRKV